MCRSKIGEETQTERDMKLKKDLKHLERRRWKILRVRKLKVQLNEHIYERAISHEMNRLPAVYPETYNGIEGLELNQVYRIAGVNL